MVQWAVLVAGVFVGGPAVADDTPISMQIGLRTGIEDSSTVTLAEEPDRHDGLLLLGLDVASRAGTTTTSAGTRSAAAC